MWVMATAVFILGTMFGAFVAGLFIHKSFIKGIDKYLSND